MVPIPTGDIMDDRKFQPIIRDIRRNSDRAFAEAAYFFVLEALDYSIFRSGQARATGDGQHISGQRLLEGIQQYATEEFGPLAPFAFRSWGLAESSDFGVIVFQMCEGGLLNARDSDSLQDFSEGFDFEKAFVME